MHIAQFMTHSDLRQNHSSDQFSIDFMIDIIFADGAFMPTDIIHWNGVNKQTYIRVNGKIPIGNR